MKIEWPNGQKLRSNDMIPVTLNGKAIGLLKEINEYGVEAVVWKGKAGLELMDDKIVGCAILSEPEEYCGNREAESRVQSVTDKMENLKK